MAHLAREGEHPADHERVGVDSRISGGAGRTTMRLTETDVRLTQMMVRLTETMVRITQ